MERRNFMKSAAGIAIGASALGMNKAFSEPVDLKDLPNEDIWKEIRKQYLPNSEFINLNNGGVSPQAIPTIEDMEKLNRYSNEGPARIMWHVVDKRREELREKLASIGGCSPEEIAINRNTTEGLNTIIFGLDLEKGDEVVLSKYDYPNMMNAWKQREKRDCIVLKWVDLEFPIQNEERIVEAYSSQFTSKTKILHLTHVINWVGEVLPTKKIADLAHSKGIEVIVDGAHSFAQMDYKISDLGCDYYATSLHKWLCAPFGTGMMYIKKDKIAKVWPVLSAPEPESDDIRKFENLGTRNMNSEIATLTAIDIHNQIGIERKRERLLYLRNYWMDRVKDLPGVGFYNSFDPEFSCSIANMYIKDKEASDIFDYLFKEHKVYTVAIKYENVNGIRVTPNIFTNEQDLDVFVNGIEEYVS